ncbi:zf-HC2 domain-containing protein [Streptomyces morookaense]|uniref:zf-HC2 domain-containing protein n=1 Tax=Streptomyces morookaense TaxID=1970 RepID=UPI0033CEE655
MHCSQARTAISARIDREELPPGTTGAALDAHLRGCAECRRWGERALRLKALARQLDTGLDTGSGIGTEVGTDIG